MPEFEYGSVSIHYEVYGSGFPVLLIAPGAMESAIRMWEGMTIDPLAHFEESFQLIGMDQRNAGRSSGPLDSSDPWGMYARDQLALLDDLSVGRFGVMGACIGGSFALKLIEQAPDRVAAAVLEQPVGITEENRPLYEDMWRRNTPGSRLDGMAVRDSGVPPFEDGT
jgi:pimeloyl-ACP methyl ester carboxylesterase